MRVEWQIGFWIGAFALLILLLWLFSGVLLPFAVALALGYLLDPVADRLERAGLNRLGATLLILAVFLVIVGLGLVLIVPVLGRQLAGFIQSLPETASKLQVLIARLGDQLSEAAGNPIFEKLGFGSGGAPSLRPPGGDLVGQAAQWAVAFLTSLWSGGTALISVFSLLVVTPVVAFYMLLDWDKMVAAVDSLVPLAHRGTVRALAREIDAAMAGFLRGQSLVCIFLGAWYGVGLSLVGLNFGLLIGLSAGVLSFIPYVGSLTALVLSAVVALVQGWPQWSLLLWSLAVVLSGQFMEGNILSPKLVGGKVGLHPVWLIFALLAFGSLFGFTGLIVAVPFAAAFGVILRFAVRRYLDSKLYRSLSQPEAVTGRASVQIEIFTGADKDH